jgi:hypothetical protein
LLPTLEMVAVLTTRGVSLLFQDGIGSTAKLGRVDAGVLSIVEWFMAALARVFPYSFHPGVAFWREGWWSQWSWASEDGGSVGSYLIRIVLRKRL